MSKTKRMLWVILLVIVLLTFTQLACDNTTYDNQGCKKEFVCKAGQTEPGCQRVLACIE